MNTVKLDAVVKMTHKNKKKSDCYAGSNVQIKMCVYMMFLSAIILLNYPNESFMQTTTSLN